MNYLSYLAYIVVWETLVFGGARYAVFVQGRSGWWFLLAFLLGCMTYSPSKWIHGLEP